MTWTRGTTLRSVSQPDGAWRHHEMRSHEQMEARKARLRQRIDGAIEALRQGKLIVAPRDANGIAAPAEECHI